jgi:hypothetical protein
MLITVEVLEQLTLGVCPFCGMDFSDGFSDDSKDLTHTEVNCACGKSYIAYNKLNEAGEPYAVRSIEMITPITEAC